MRFLPKRHHPQNVAKLVNYFDQFEHVEFVDLTDAICRNGVCRMKVGANNAMYTDDSHLSYKGAELVLGHYHNSTNEAQQFTYDRQ